MTDAHELYKEIWGLIGTYLYPLSVTSHYAHPFRTTRKITIRFIIGVTLYSFLLESENHLVLIF